MKGSMYMHGDLGTSEIDNQSFIPCRTKQQAAADEQQRRVLMSRVAATAIGASNSHVAKQACSLQNPMKDIKGKEMGEKKRIEHPNKKDEEGTQPKDQSHWTLPPLIAFKQVPED